MNLQENHLRKLAEQARQGDRAAMAAFEREFGAGIVPIVRRAMRTGQSSLPVMQFVQETARRLFQESPGSMLRDSDETVRRIADSVLGAVVGSLREKGEQSHWSMETVRG